MNKVSFLLMLVLLTPSASMALKKRSSPINEIRTILNKEIASCSAKLTKLAKNPKIVADEIGTVGGQQPKILFLGASVPVDMKWRDSEIKSSMRNSAVDVLRVHVDKIEGNEFVETDLHGIPDRVVYGLGLASLNNFRDQLKLESYTYGFLGENILFDSFDENDISVGDIFRIGDVLLQVTGPRLPCKKINFTMENPRGLKCFHQGGQGLTGVYFRVLKPGLIRSDSKVVRVARPATLFPVTQLFLRIAMNEPLTKEELALAQKNGFFNTDWMLGWGLYYASNGKIKGYPMMTPPPSKDDK